MPTFINNRKQLQHNLGVGSIIKYTSFPGGGDRADVLSLGSANQVLTSDGSDLVYSLINTDSIADSAVTDAKIDGLDGSKITNVANIPNFCTAVNDCVADQSTAYYTSVSTDTSTGGTNTITPTGHDLIMVNPSSVLSGTRTSTLDTAGVDTGYAVKFNTTGLTSADIANFNFVVSYSGSSANLQPNTIYEFVYDGSNWIRTI